MKIEGAIRSLQTIRVGAISDFGELAPKEVTVNGLSLFVYRHGGNYYCYRNRCPHQGGPACEGDLRGRVVGTVDENGMYLERTSKKELSIVCPWHGVEYDLKNGECRTDSKLKLRSYEVLIEDGEVKIKI